jgi:hypothetical protein
MASHLHKDLLAWLRVIPLSPYTLGCPFENIILKIKKFVMGYTWRC